jgi:hypothetical protein
VESVFNLLGEHENDLTYSLAWALSQSPHFLKGFIRTTLDGTLVTEASENLKNGDRIRDTQSNLLGVNFGFSRQKQLLTPRESRGTLIFHREGGQS